MFLAIKNIETLWLFSLSSVYNTDWMKEGEVMERVGDNEGSGKLLQYNNAFEKLVFLTSIKLSAFLMLHNGRA